MTTVAVLFPGQGEQRPGMLHELPVTEVLTTAGEVLGLDPLTLDTPGQLAGTHATQLCLLIAGVSGYRALTAEGLAPQYVAGHSIGTWAAAVAAGALDLADAVRLVDLRGRAMAEATPPDGGMLVSLGLPEHVVAAEAERVRAEGHQVWPSNVNAPTQVTSSGTADGLDALAHRLREAGATKVRRLAVAVPAHCPLMTPAADRLRAMLDTVEVRRPAVPLAGNLTGQTLFTADKLRADLVDSLDHGVQWATATGILAERGVDRWIQVPPGDTLTRLVTADHPGGRAIAVETAGVSEAVRRALR